MAKKLTKVGDRTEDGTLRCPKCGGTSFRSQRGPSKYVAGPLAPKRRVVCETCGAKFRKGVGWV